MKYSYLLTYFDCRWRWTTQWCMAQPPHHSSSVAVLLWVSSRVDFSATSVVTCLSSSLMDPCHTIRTFPSHRNSGELCRAEFRWLLMKLCFCCRCRHSFEEFRQLIRYFHHFSPVRLLCGICLSVCLHVCLFVCLSFCIFVCAWFMMCNVACMWNCIQLQHSVVCVKGCMFAINFVISLGYCCSLAKNTLCSSSSSLYVFINQPTKRSIM